MLAQSVLTVAEIRCSNTSTEAVLAQLDEEMRAQTPQGMMSAGNLVSQVIVLSIAVFIVIDYPQGTDGRLCGPTD